MHTIRNPRKTVTMPRDNEVELVSIVVPVFNVIETLTRCVESIMQQEYQNLQIILVDDGSTDGSAEACESFRESDERIEVLHTANSGLSAARNAGMRLVRGTRVVFVDSDDAIGPRHISRLYSCLLHCHDASMSVAVTGFSRVEYGSAQGDPQVSGELSYTKLSPSEAVAESSLVGGRFAAHAWGKMYPESLFGLLSYPIGKFYEDQFVTPKVFMASSEIVYESADDYLYTVDRPGSISFGSRLRELDYLEGIRETFADVEKRYAEAVPAVSRRYRATLVNGLETACVTGRQACLDSLYEEAMAQRPYALADSELAKGTRLKYRALKLGKEGFASIARARSLLKSNSPSVIAEKTENRIGRSRDRNKLLADYQAKAARADRPISFLVMTPRYRNYGDQLIAFSELRLLEEAGVENVIEVPYEDCDLLGNGVAKLVGELDAVLFTGGGYLGDLWPGLEHAAESILSSLSPRNRVLFFPESVYCSNGRVCESSFSRALAPTSANAAVCVRERPSYERLSGCLPGSWLSLLPDVGLFVRRSDLMAHVPQRNGRRALVCIRHDKENLQSATFGVELTAALNRAGMDIRAIDTHDPKGELDPGERKVALAALAEEFGKASLVVTNRLHGMIFAMIMGTPCVALDNVSRKVSGVAEWVKPEYPIVLCDETCIDVAVSEAIAMEPYAGDVADLLGKERMALLDLIRKAVSDG